MSDKVLLDKHDATAVVTINNPASHNALSKDVMAQLISTMKLLADDSTVRAIVLTGAGNKAFCVGLDLKEISGNNGVNMGQAGGRTMGVESPLVKAFSETPQPIIAAVNGFAITGGFELALACDFMVCSDTAQFADTHALVGLLPGWGLSQILPRLIGLNKAKEMSFTGRYVSAQEALNLGLVNHVFPAEALLGEALKIAERIVWTDPYALHKIKRMMDDGNKMTMSDALIMEGDLAESHIQNTELSYLEDRLKTIRELAKK